MNIKDNLAQIHQQISQACQQAHRNDTDVQLLAVSKTKPSELVLEAYQAGQRHFGENYVQEAVDKIALLSHLPEICWHFIGPIQSNKTRLIAENFSWVHSVDRIKVAARLNEQRSGQDTPLNICLQVNISQEHSKSGISLEEISDLAQYVNNCTHLTLRGLMAIPQKNAPVVVYQQMAELFSQLHAQYDTVDTLSMGMSNDLTQAILSGSTMVRIGTAIFGERN
ncbi:YggS family pyridoxal phosphate-dependent enzyme [Colwellia sp. MEBiC06753]